MEQPRLGVKCVLVVSYETRTSAPSSKRPQCLGFRRARVGRSQDTKWLAVLDVSPERLCKWVDARARMKAMTTSIRSAGRDLCLDLVTDARLAGRIREERRIEQRDQWRINHFR